MLFRERNAGGNTALALAKIDDVQSDFADNGVNERLGQILVEMNGPVAVVQCQSLDLALQDGPNHRCVDDPGHVGHGVAFGVESGAQKFAPMSADQAFLKIIYDVDVLDVLPDADASDRNAAELLHQLAAD